MFGRRARGHEGSETPVDMPPKKVRGSTSEGREQRGGRETSPGIIHGLSRFTGRWTQLATEELGSRYVRHTTLGISMNTKHQSINRRPVGDPVRKQRRDELLILTANAVPSSFVGQFNEDAIKAWRHSSET
ncbi:hypothetical protein PG985_003446 [Apiospora marii]|uniref:uncharacterized protein n=1 Tax=Apiospora marii TaxID=335849 RepID=UPI00312D18FF